MNTPPSPDSALDAWLTAARDEVAQEAGIVPSELELGEAAMDKILDLARIAAHDSGDRRNAPLLCYLVGRAGPDVDLAALVRRIEELPAG